LIFNNKINNCANTGLFSRFYIGHSKASYNVKFQYFTNIVKQTIHIISKNVNKKQ